MSSEHVYRYMKERPIYTPDKFAIVGGATVESGFRQIMNAASAQGGSDFSGQDLSTIQVDDNGVTIVGGALKSIRSASTVDDRLAAIFGTPDADMSKPMSRGDRRTAKAGLSAAKAAQRLAKKLAPARVHHAVPDIVTNRCGGASSDEDDTSADSISDDVSTESISGDARYSISDSLIDPSNNGGFTDISAFLN